MGTIKLSDEIRAAIQVAFDKGMEAGRLKTKLTPKDTYEATQERLKALTILRLKGKADAEQLAKLRTEGTPERNAQLKRFKNSNFKLPPEEMLAMLIRELESVLLIDRQEVEAMELALTVIQDDPFYLVISGKYLDNLSDYDIAAQLSCDPSTVRRNRGRLIRKMAVRIFGIQAVE